MGDVVTTKQRNIEELGFPQELHRSADGVFLDLPGPWHVSPQLLSSAAYSSVAVVQACLLQPGDN